MPSDPLKTNQKKQEKKEKKKTCLPPGGGRLPPSEGGQVAKCDGQRQTARFIHDPRGALFNNRSLRETIENKCSSVLNTRPALEKDAYEVICDTNDETHVILFRINLWHPRVVWNFFFVIDDANIHHLRSITMLDEEQQPRSTVWIDEQNELIWQKINKIKPNDDINKLQDLINERKDKTNQYGWALIICSDHLEVIPVKKPDFNKSNKNSKKKNIHVEQLLIEEICEFMKNSKKNVLNVIIYTYNSPCLKRDVKDKIDPCLIQLIKSASEWYSKKHAGTYVFCSKSWGPLHHTNLKFLTYSKLINPDNVFHEYLQKQYNKRFKMDQTCFKDNTKKIKKVHDIDKLHVTQFNDELTRVKNELTRKELTIKEHLDYLEEVVNNDNENTSETVRNNIYDMFLNMEQKYFEQEIVFNSRQDITSDFNNIIVKCLLEDLPSIFKDKSYFRLHHVQQDPLKKIND
ncbi:uncharacterized protein LOC114865014 isoform X2 [Betta splendens]|uniref:Uncharacterized protein LOC114865014 isoform X2 n=1 Tax=Betta splendens TaxID=158456 RepID=A0A6P7NPS6_BETSP|nr:uncharacterized protein LOC114865014 isoform X2 [Betta splendens]